ncbi:hypothetical protein [Enterococcus sp. UD-01]|uniref:hypothetical protein n=1 Tax=Enterococcus sp. UD-01 TaxID=3373911 RepID=UPI003833F143
MIEKSKESANEIEKISKSLSILESEKEYENNVGMLTEIHRALAADTGNLCLELYLISGSNIRYILKSKEHHDQFIQLLSIPQVLTQLEKAKSTEGFTELLNVLERADRFYSSQESIALIDKIKEIYEKVKSEEA